MNHIHEEYGFKEPLANSQADHFRQLAEIRSEDISETFGLGEEYPTAGNQRSHPVYYDTSELSTVENNVN